MIDGPALLAALLAGLLGSGHCAAMCGGIATGFPALATRGGWWAALVPNLGRLSGYVLAGVLAGALGYGLIGWMRTPWLATTARVLLGLVLIALALRLLDARNRLGFLARPGAALWARLRPLTRHLLPANTGPRRFLLGLLWGWLPCGLSGLLLTTAWLQADPLDGALTLLAFGLGTLPVMLPLTWSGQRIGQRLRQGRWRTAGAALVLASGLLTLSAPWLMQLPGLHRVLGAIGCVG